MDTIQLLNIALKASYEAGAEIMKIYESGDFGVDMKSDDSPLTKADIASHNIILKHLSSTNIPVLSEEGKDIPFDERKNWDLLWIVDPIDGTKEFIKKNGEFTVNIALIQNNSPILGVVYAPALNELYYSTKELGAFLSHNKDFIDFEGLKTSSIKLPQENLMDTYTVVASRSHMSPETEEFINELKNKYGEVELISRGSSLKLCMVANGKANCYPRFAPTMEWDTAAGQAICMHAGFDVIDWTTKETMIYNREQLLNNWFLVN